VLKSFDSTNFIGMKKFESLKKTLLNLLKNDVNKRLNRKGISDSERNFLRTIKENDDKKNQLKDPDSTLFNVIIANTLAFM
jgi:hypothetical protein